MGKNLIRKNSLILVVSAILLSMVTACAAKPSDVPVSSININTVSTSETSDPSVSVPDKVITTGIDVIDMEDNTKQIKVYVDEREIDGVLYLPEGTGPFPVCYIAQGLGAPYYAYIDIAEAMAANGIAAVLIDFEAENGEYSYVTEAEDLIAMFDGVTSLPYIYCHDTFFWGHSFGALVTAYAGCEYYSYYSEKLKGLILLEPSFDFSDDIYDKMPDFGGMVMIFAGKAEGSIGGSSPDKLENAKKAFQNADIRYFEGEDHYFHGPERDAMIQASIDFIRNNMEKN